MTLQLFPGGDSWAEFTIHVYILTAETQRAPKVFALYIPLSAFCLLLSSLFSLLFQRYHVPVRPWRTVRTVRHFFWE